MNTLLKPTVLGSFVLAAALLGCVFDNDTTVAGGEDFPNTITPLGKVTADNISSFTNWDQFQGIDTTPDLSTDSLTKTMSSAKLIAAKLMAVAVGVRDTTVILHGPNDLVIVEHIRINGKVVEEYDLLRSRNGDTLEWTQLSDADNDGNLWGNDSSGIVELIRQVKDPLSRPSVERKWSTLKARIYHRGKNSVPIFYTERCILRDGDTTVFTASGIHGDSLVSGDTSLVTFDRTPSGSDSLLESKGRYWVRLGKLVRPFADNALLRFEIRNLRRTGVIRYDSIAFTPDSAVVSGHLNIRGTFLVSAEDETGSIKSQVAGTFRNDSIQANMRETRDGKVKNYHMVYDNRGEVQERDTLPDGEDSSKVLKPMSFGRNFGPPLSPQKP